MSRAVAAVAIGTCLLVTACGGGDDADQVGFLDQSEGDGAVSDGESDEPAGDSGGGEDDGRVRPVVFSPCDALAPGDQPLAAMGLDVPLESRYEDDGYATCRWNSEAGGLDVVVSRQSNSADARTGWENPTAEHSEEVDVAWSPDGVMRVVERNDVQVATLWALVINTDYVNRDIYVTMWVTTEADADGNVIVPGIDVQKAALLELGETLSEAIRSAQPDGVILPTV